MKRFNTLKRKPKFVLEIENQFFGCTVWFHLPTYDETVNASYFSSIDIDNCNQDVNKMKNKMDSLYKKWAAEEAKLV